MKKSIYLVKLIGLGVILSGLIVTSSYADKKQSQNGVFKPAVLDRELIFKQSKATQALRDQIQAKWAEHNKKFQAEQKSLYAKSQKMAEEKTKLKEADFQRKQVELTQQETNLQIKVQEEKQKLNEAFNNGLKEIEKELNAIIKQYATKNRITFLAAKDMVILNEENYDITGDILKELDKELPTYKVKFKQ